MFVSFSATDITSQTQVRMFQLGFLLLFSTEAFAQLQGFEACQDVNAMTNFNKTSYLGTWFEIWTYIPFTESSIKCLSANYKNDTENSMSITVTQISTVTNNPIKFDGEATLIGDVYVGKFLAEYPTMRSIVWILDTDYITFAVALTCRDISEKNTQNVIIFGRERTLPDKAYKKALTILDNHQLSRDKLKKSNQENCPLVD